MQFRFGRGGGRLRRRTRLAACAIALFTIGQAASAEEAVHIQSPYSFTETVDRLRTALAARGLTVFAKIDHQANAQAVGLDMPPATVLIYGNPKAGTPLMLAAPDFALDLPLRVLIREGEDGATVVVLDGAAELEGRHGLPAGMAAKLAPAETVIAQALAAATPSAD